MKEGDSRQERREEGMGREGGGSLSSVCFLCTSQTLGSQAAKNAQKKTLVQYHTFNYT